MNKYALISIDHINQLIPAYAALKHVEAETNLPEKPLLILTKPHIPFNAQKLGHIRELVSSEPNVSILEGYSLFKYPRLMTYIPVRLRARMLQKKLQNYVIDTFYYAHDISSDFWNQTLMHALPNAERICYGDALGLVYTPDYFTRLMYRINNKNKVLLHNIFARLKRALIYPTKKNQLMPQLAVLAIPCDPGKDFLTKCKLSVIKQERFKQYVATLAKALPAFKNHMPELAKTGENDCYLLMLSNFTESKLITLDNEISLYQEILGYHASKKSTIIIKPHPASHPEILKQIIEALSEDYVIQIIHQEYYHLPIELAERLVLGCKVLSVSYSSISLPYIYNQQVTHVLTEELIYRYFSIEKMSWFVESNRLYLDMIQAIQHWTQDCELPI